MADNGKGVISLYAVGDVCVNRDNPEAIFALVAPALKEADISFCQLETNYSERGAPSIAAISPKKRPAPKSPRIISLPAAVRTSTRTSPMTMK